MEINQILKNYIALERSLITEALSLDQIATSIKGYEADENIRVPIIARMAKANQLPGLFDPTNGHYITADGDDDEEADDETAGQLSTLGLLPQNAKIEGAGWFDNADTKQKADADLRQRSQAADSHNYDPLADFDKIDQLAELVRDYIEMKGGQMPEFQHPKPTPEQPQPGQTPSPFANPRTPSPSTPSPSPVSSPSTPAPNTLTYAESRQRMSSSLVESFGYKKQPLYEYKIDWQSVRDFGSGALDGVTGGLANPAIAGAKSLYKGTEFSDELDKEDDDDYQASLRSPKAYAAGDTTGTIGSYLANPGSIGLKLGSKLGAGALGRAAVAGSKSAKAALAAGKGAINIGTGAATDAAQAKGMELGADAIDKLNKDPVSEMARLRRIMSDPYMTSLTEINNNYDRMMSEGSDHGEDYMLNHEPPSDGEPLPNSQQGAQQYSQQNPAIQQRQFARMEQQINQLFSELGTSKNPDTRRLLLQLYQNLQPYAGRQ